MALAPVICQKPTNRMSNIHGCMRKTFTSAGVDVVGLDAAAVEGGVRATEVEFGTGGSELERKHIRADGTRIKGVVEERGLLKVGDGWVRQTHQAEAP
jgi:hypothetical protein